MDDTAVSGKVSLVHSGGGRAISICGGAELFGLSAPRTVLRKRNSDFQVRADGDVETRDEGGAVAAEIFAGSIFFEGEAVGVAPADFQRQADRDSTFRALLRNGRARDRKSTRLNSSHSQISYAGFCLKKKKTTHNAMLSNRETRHSIIICLLNTTTNLASQALVSSTNLTSRYPQLSAHDQTRTVVIVT